MEEPDIDPHTDQPSDSPSDLLPDSRFERLLAGSLVGGIVLAKVIGLVGGIARVAVPVAAGFVTREWLDAKARARGRPVVGTDADASIPAETASTPEAAAAEDSPREADREDESNVAPQPSASETPLPDELPPDPGLATDESAIHGSCAPSPTLEAACGLSEEEAGPRGLLDGPLLAAPLSPKRPIGQPRVLPSPFFLAGAAPAAEPTVPTDAAHVDPDPDDTPSDTPSDAPSDAPAEAPPCEPAAPIPVAKSAPDPDDDFDPIAIFLRGRDEEAPPANRGDARLPTRGDGDPHDEPTEESFIAVTGGDPASKHSTEGDDLAPHEIPAKSPTRLPPPRGNRSPRRRRTRRSLAFRPPAPPQGPRPPEPHAASETPSLESMAAASPFLLARASNEALFPTLEPPPVAKAKATAPPKRAAALPTLFLFTVLSVAVGGGIFLYLNPDRNPFRKPELAYPSPSHSASAAQAGIPDSARRAERASPGEFEEPSAPEDARPIEPIEPIEPAEITDIPSLDGADIEEVVKDPERTLRAFLGARSADGRLRLVHQPEGIHERMEAHGRTHGTGPIPYRTLALKLSGTVPGSDFETHLFLVTTASHPDGMPVSVEETAQGYRIDWDAFVQFNDGLLEDFLDDPASPGAPFYVMLRRTHYFGSDVPDLEAKLCYRVMSPIAAGNEAYAFIAAESELGRTAATDLSWGRTYRPVVRLEWVREGTEPPYLSIAAIVRSTWRGMGVEVTH